MVMRVIMLLLGLGLEKVLASCHASCLSSCTGPSASECQNCAADGSYLDIGTNLDFGTCRCLSGFEPQESPVTDCVLCHASCYTCGGAGADHCIDCHTSGATIPSGSPVTGGVCSCGGTYIVSATSPTYDTCLSCNSVCQTCTGPLNTDCLTCKASGATVSGGICKCSGQYIYQENPTSACLGCHPSCSTCSTSSASGCKSCKAAHATVSSIPGTCACDTQYVYALSPTTDCQKCSDSCATCTAVGSNKCSTCVASGATVTNGICYCSGQYLYAVSPTTNCVLCASHCASCSSTSSFCLTCKAAGALANASGDCVCSQGYAPSTNTATCTSCHGSCSSCSAGTGQANECLTCKASGATLLANGTCACTGQYVSVVSPTVNCVSCHSSCATCNGGADVNCLTCKATNAAINGSGICACPAGFMPAERPTTACVPCDNSCLTCSLSGSGVCLTCKAQYAVAPGGGGACACPAGFVSTPNPTTACVSCHASCLTCVGSASSQCVTCKAAGTTTPPVTGGTCSCLDGYVPSTSPTTACVSCDGSCATCSSVSYCLTCKAAGATLTTGTCRCQGNYIPVNNPTTDCQVCHPSCLTCSIAGPSGCLTCIASHASTLSGGGVCSCDSGYQTLTSPTAACQQCANQCLTCSASGTENCLTCRYTGATCGSGGHCNCGSGYLFAADPTSNCTPCEGTCQECDGPTSSDCTACKASHTKAVAGHGTCECLSGYFPQNASTSTCTQCHYTCKECSGANDDNCVSCWTDLHADPSVNMGKCLCGSNYFMVKNSLNCSECYATCKVCADGNNNYCQFCPTHDGASCKCATCTLCHTSCKSCSGPNYNDCTECVAHTDALSSNPGACNCAEHYYSTGSPMTCSGCHDSCVNCLDEYPTTCITCIASNTNPVNSISGGTCVCKNGYQQALYPTSPCIKCANQCATCSAEVPPKCLSCVATGTRTLSSGDCSCRSSGYVPALNPTTDCTPCHESCTTCSNGTDSGCVTCKALGAQSRSGVCTCTGKYVYEVRPITNCRLCDPTCSTCSGVLNTECITCKSIGAAVPDGGGMCQCQNGFVPGTTLNAPCEACHPSCVTCLSAGETGCETCIAQGAAPNASGICSCTNGFIPADSPTTDCVLCDTPCNSCDVSGGCTSCSAGGAIAGVDGVCRCSSQFLQEDNPINDCVPCNLSCSTCGPTEDFCLTCTAAGAIPDVNGSCICQGGLVPTPVANECSSCHESCGTCISIGASGCISCKATGAIAPSGGGMCKCSGIYVPEDSPVNPCSRCFQACTTCSGPGESECLTCLATGATAPDGGGKCICSGKYVPEDSPTSSCTLCSPQCSSCSAFGVEFCISCVSEGATVQTDHCRCGGRYIPEDDPTGSSCTACHGTCESCNGPDDTDCTLCLSAGAEVSLLSSKCECSAGYVPNLSPTTACALCSDPCETCSDVGPDKCLSCIAQYATVDSGFCVCGSGYVPETSPLNDCVACDPLCASCTGPSVSDCSDGNEISEFINASINLNGNLPYLTQTDTLICYRFQPSIACAEALYTSLLGNLNIDASGNWHLSQAQCDVMLKLEWDSVSDDFDELFPNFTPIGTSEENITVKTLLRMWIFEFGRTNINYQSDWQDVRDIFNNIDTQWSTVLGWGGATPGFSVGSVSYTFPPDLKDRIDQDSAPLSAFNLWSQVCDNSGCSHKADCCNTPQFVTSNCCLH